MLMSTLLSSNSRRASSLRPISRSVSSFLGHGRGKQKKVNWPTQSKAEKVVQQMPKIMQDEALDFSLKQATGRPSETASNTEILPVIPTPNNALAINHPYFTPPVLEEAHKHLLQQLSPFALLSPSGGITVNSIETQMALMTNQLLPTTSLALTTLHRRRRRISNGSADEFATAKKLRSIPVERKDDAYWERRRKNNEAAKRSRDTRKAKEDEIAFRAAYLEQENLKLKAQLTMLKSEMSRLQALIFTQPQQ